MIVFARLLISVFGQIGDLVRFQGPRISGYCIRVHLCTHVNAHTHAHREDGGRSVRRGNTPTEQQQHSIRHLAKKAGFTPVFGNSM